MLIVFLLTVYVVHKRKVYWLEYKKFRGISLLNTTNKFIPVTPY
ncbi:unnamed protein product [Nezara viridula]|uniref:Uncharacterized protein n=1 Tax=Nezara viridula TaxID=85310 RepID=A0A9P0H9I2_NEZVI|nr:unnamed protein product [Nezara viridula]